MDDKTQLQIAEKIDQIRMFENMVPAVLIVHSFPELTVEYMSRRGLKILGITLAELKAMDEEYHTRFFNADDAREYIPKMRGLLERNDTNEMITFFQQVRPSPEHEWALYLSSTKIIMRGDDGKPLLTLTMSVPIDSRNHITSKVDRLLQENNYLREHHHLFASLTKREQQVLRLIALGLNSAEIAVELNISTNTANTHRKNIKSKLGIQNAYGITQFAQAFNLI